MKTLKSSLSSTLFPKASFAPYGLISFTDCEDPIFIGHKGPLLNAFTANKTLGSFLINRGLGQLSGQGL